MTNISPEEEILFISDEISREKKLFLFSFKVHLVEGVIMSVLFFIFLGDPLILLIIYLIGPGIILLIGH